jgi:OmpA-OmpF porin, OOP family
MPRLASATALFSLLLATGVTAAQPAGDLPLDTFKPAVDSRGMITINASQPLGNNELSFGLGALAWGHKLLAFDDGTNQYTVTDVITATLIAAYGIHVGPLELELGGSLPLTILTGDRGAIGTGPNDALQLGEQGVGNAGLHLKTRFIKSSRPPHLGVGMIASVYLPTADPKASWMGDDQVTPQLLGIVDKEFGRDGRLRLSLNAGVRLRRTRTFIDMGDGGAPATNGTITASAELPVGFGAAWALSPHKFDLVGEVFGAIPIGENEGYRPLEAIAGAKVYLARNSYLSFGAGRGLDTSQAANPAVRAFIGIVFEPNLGDRDGDGLKDDVDRCPDDPEDRDGFDDEDGCPDNDNDRDGILDMDDRCPLVPEDRDGFQDEDGCPEGNANDRDNDGILDNLDKCPDEPEDFDNFQDQDGCPDPDNDGDRILDVDDLCPNDPEDFDKFEDEDGCPDNDNDKDRILDKLDKCPNQPETYNNVDDEDGCPDADRGVVIEKKTILEILRPINFEFDSAVIKKDSYYILDAVAAALNGNPNILLVEVAGHTDERGEDAYNLDLSDRRAASVVKYLTEHGIDRKRLESQGYGETRPVINEHSEAAWAKNRRVEFLILKRAEEN